MNTSVFEKSTDDLRQVRHTEWAGDHFLVYFTVQRRWLVANGPAYSSPERKSPQDLMVRDWYPMAGEHFGFGFQPVKEEWRDLPCVNGFADNIKPPQL